MKLAIVGSRHYHDYEAFEAAVNAYRLLHFPVDELVSGGAEGADTLAERYAREHGLPITVFLPDWEQFGRGAGPRRNKQIVSLADAMVAFLAPNSRGTRNSIFLARKKGIPVSVVEVGE